MNRKLGIEATKKGMAIPELREVFGGAARLRRFSLERGYGKAQPQVLAHGHHGSSVASPHPLRLVLPPAPCFGATQTDTVAPPLQLRQIQHPRGGLC